MGSVALQWLALLPYSKKVLGSNCLGPLYARVCAGFHWLLRFPPN